MSKWGLLESPWFGVHLVFMLVTDDFSSSAGHEPL